MFSVGTFTCLNINTKDKLLSDAMCDSFTDNAIIEFVPVNWSFISFHSTPIK